MPASLDTHLVQGLEINFDGTRMSATVPYFIKDLETPAGGDPLDLLAEALEVTGVPAYGDSKVIKGRTVYAYRFRVTAWADSDAELQVTFVEDNAGGPSGINSEIEVGSTIEIAESDFEGSERVKPWNERSPLWVGYNPEVDVGEAAFASDQRQYVRLPYFAGKPFRRYTMTLGEDPGPLAENFVGATNSVPWNGYDVNEVLCMGIVGRNAGQGFRTTFDFGIDRVTKWMQVARYKDPATGDPVKVTNNQVAARNGIKDFVMQVPRDFHTLPIPVNS
jgi:hypothetical protein